MGDPMAILADHNKVTANVVGFITINVVDVKLLLISGLAANLTNTVRLAPYDGGIWTKSI